MMKKTAAETIGKEESLKNINDLEVERLSDLNREIMEDIAWNWTRTRIRRKTTRAKERNTKRIEE